MIYRNQNKKGFWWKSIDHDLVKYDHVIEFNAQESTKLLMQGVRWNRTCSDSMTEWLAESTIFSRWSPDGAMPSTLKLEFTMNSDMEEFMVELKLRWL